MDTGAAVSETARVLTRPPRVLVVDDDPAVRLLCATSLRRAGCEVIEACNGQEGLERARNDAPDIALLDISMPILDGFGLAAALREDARTHGLPFVFLSGEADPQIVGRAYEAGARGYFAKPFSPPAVVSFIRGVLAHGLPEPTATTGGHAF